MPLVANSSVALDRPRRSFVVHVTLREPGLSWQCHFTARPLLSIASRSTKFDGRIIGRDLAIGGLAMVPFILGIKTGVGVGDHEH